MHSRVCSLWAFVLGTLLQTTLVQASAWAPWATVLSRTGWTVTADSQQPGNNASYAIDGNNNTFWHTQYTPSIAQLPHTFTIDMKRNYVVNGVSYLPRQDGNSNGNVGAHTWSLSTDGSNFAVVAYGTYLNDATQKTTYFTNTTARYVRLYVTTEAQGNNNPWTSAAEINVYSPNPSLSSYSVPNPATYGRWDATVDLPLVPAAGAVTYSGTVVFWSAYRPDLFTSSTGITDTAYWTYPSQTGISQTYVTNTGHGISIDSNGRIVVTGGNTNQKTSIEDPASLGWTSAAQMNIGRGYHAQVTISDGRIFTIGGSWSGGYGCQGGVPCKNGEIYDPIANTWTLLNGCLVTPMLTNDAAGAFRTDNHGWLFAWKGNSIFQAGPSHAMNWYNVSGNGGQVGAGPRASDPDSMCGIASMYDAVAGKILTVGGSPSYQDSPATSNAHIITLGNPGSTTTSVTTLGNAAFARSFHNGIVLPDGTTFIVGGQSYPIPFSDTTPQFIPELFNPSTNTFRQMAPIAVPRNYHSIGFLLPDARVLNGGGGLCGTGCQQNHFDAQIYSPPYLFTSSGALATRPVINSVSSSSFKPGTTITVVTNSPISQFSMIRSGSATHTVNTDQRRIPLTFSTTGTNTYSMTVPSDPGVAVPGYYMLFAITSSNVPSVAKFIQVTT